jgi:hypothetical protein
MGALEQLRAKHKVLLDAVTKVYADASTANREITDEEFRSISTSVEDGNKLADQIEQLADFQARSAAIGRIAAEVTTGGADPDNPSGQGAVEGQGERSLADAEKGRTGRVTTKDRDPGHYRSAKDGGRNSYFHDVWSRKVDGDAAAVKRLDEHTRAFLVENEQYRAVVSSGSPSGGAGVVVPHWLVEEYAPISRQARMLASRVRNISLGGDPRPITLPKQTAGTDNNVTQQTTEGQNNGVGRTTADMTVTNTGWGTDAFQTSVDVVTPKPFGGYQDVSRQFLDMATPAGDQLIYADLMSVLDFKVETLVGNTMLAAAIAGDTIPTDATGGATSFVGSGVAAGSVIDGEVTAYVGRQLPPDILALSPGRWGKFRKLSDTTGRPLMPVSRYNVMNGDGLVTGSVMEGEFEGLSAIATLGMGAGTAYPEKFLVARSQDTILFTDDVMQFRFEEVVGPSDIRMGIWAYTACVTRWGGLGTVAITVTAA